jgi:hypothetical protein
LRGAVQISGRIENQRAKRWNRTVCATEGIQSGRIPTLVTAYALKRPDGKWSLLVVNRDQENSHRVRIAFSGDADSVPGFAGPVDIATFGSAQYKWNLPRTRFMAHAEVAAAPTIVAYTCGTADPDGPISRSQQDGTKQTLYDLPPSSVVVIRGNVAAHWDCRYENLRLS